MTTPYTPNPSTPVAMIALQELYQALWSGRIPNVAPGQPFWARYADSSGLIAGGLARLWVSGSDPAMPPPEQPNTAHGIPGFGNGTANSSPGVQLPVYAGPPPRRQN
jgi:hypothetical protein